MTRIHARYTGSRTDHAAIRAVFRDPDEPVGRDLDTRSLRVLARAQTLVGKQSRRLLNTGRRKFGQTVVGPYRDVTFGQPGRTPYLGWHMEGVAPHVITVRRRKALRFAYGGKIQFARKVQHPGNPANQFLVKALDAAR